MKKLVVLQLFVFLFTLVVPFVTTDLAYANSSGINAQGTIHNSSFVTLRSAPQLEAQPVAVLPFSEELTVLSTEGDWVRVSCSRGTGYMRRHYIRYGVIPPRASQASYQVPLVESVQLGTSMPLTHNEDVYLRQDKSVVANSPLVVKPGQNVMVLSVEAGWCKVNVDGQTGYIRSCYLGLSDNAIGFGTTSSTTTSSGTPESISANTGRIQDGTPEIPVLLPPPSQTINLPTEPVAPPTTSVATPPASNLPVDNTWRNGFNELNTMSDQEFTNPNGISQSEIQAIFDKRDSVLAKKIGDVLPSQAIMDAAKKHGINPRLLLARLQVEQGLVSKKTATRHKLDWALGCGAYDSGDWNQAFKGFDKQVDGAAKTLKRWYDYAQSTGQRTIKVDGQNRVYKNAATYSLYKYTPHVAGNNLHWKVYTSFFPN